MGFIEKRSGGYRARYRDPLGHLTSKTFTRKADAERWAREMEVDMERGDWLDPAGAQVPLATWADEFLSLARRLSPTTQETYRRDLTKYIVPRFGAYRIGRLPADEIENWLNDEIAAGLAPSTVHRHYRTFRRVLQVAVEKRKIQANPCDRVEPPRVPKREMSFLTWEQSVALAEAHQERYRALIYLAVDSGMRWSELVGLRRARVDLRRGKVRVTEQLVRLEGGKWLRKEPKTPASVRSITVSPVTAELLAEHVERFVADGPDAAVFANTVGSPLISSSFWQHHFSKALRAAEVSCRFHDLRHTSVALAIAEGAHPKAIQTRMGHSSIAVTLDRYGHLFPELDEAIAVSFGARLRDARASATPASTPVTPHNGACHPLRDGRPLGSPERSPSRHLPLGCEPSCGWGNGVSPECREDSRVAAGSRAAPTKRRFAAGRSQTRGGRQRSQTPCPLDRDSASATDHSSQSTACANPTVSPTICQNSATSVTEDRMNRREAMALTYDKLTDSQREAVESIARSLNSASTDLQSQSQSRSPGDSDRRTSQSFFVSGEPGSGKTTVYLTMRRLIESDEQGVGEQMALLRTNAPQLRWLDPLDLEPAADMTNFLAAVLVRIGDVTANTDRDTLEEDRRPGVFERHDARQDLRRLESDVVLAWEGTVPQRAERVDPEVFAQDVIRAERARLKLNERVRNVLTKLSENKSPKPSLFVLPVDDFYLRPAASLEFLRLLRMISVPQLFILIMGDLEVVEQLFFQDMLGQLVRLAGENVFMAANSEQKDILTARASALTSHAMSKLIPLGQRVQLEAMRRLQALSFRPPGTDGGGKDLHALLRAVEIDLDPIRLPMDAQTRTMHPTNMADFLLLRSVAEEAGDDAVYESYSYSGLAVLDLPPREVADLWHVLDNLVRPGSPDRGEADRKDSGKRQWEVVLGKMIEQTLEALAHETFLGTDGKHRCEAAFRGTKYDRRIFDTDALQATAAPARKGSEVEISLAEGRLLTAVPHIAWVIRPHLLEGPHDREGDDDYLAPRPNAWFTVIHDLMALSPDRMEGAPLTVPPFQLGWVAASGGVLGRVYWLTPAWPSFRHFDMLAFRWNRIVAALGTLEVPDESEKAAWLAYSWLDATVEILRGKWEPERALQPDIVLADHWLALASAIDELVGNVSAVSSDTGAGNDTVVRDWLRGLDVFLHEQFGLPQVALDQLRSGKLPAFWDRERDDIDAIRQRLAEFARLGLENGEAHTP